MALKSVAFQGNFRLEWAAQGKSIRPGETGHAVALLQAGLISLGYRMPISTTRKHGAADGIYGDETRRVVRQFQADQKLSSDGTAGRNTVLRLDALLPPASLPKPPEPVPPPPGPPMPASTDFKIGTDDPKITPDAGAGPWNSKPKQVLTAVKYAGILEVLGPAYVIIGDDATNHMAHYLRDTGSPLTIDLEGMVAEVPSAKALFEIEVAKTKAYAERLPPGVHDITATHAVNGYNRKSESTNWFFAVGGYSVWTKGRVTVSGSGPGHDIGMELQYKFYDRYNWDSGKSVTIGGIKISDEAMGEFHREGMAREYDEAGSLTRSLKWKAP